MVFVFGVSPSPFRRGNEGEVKPKEATLASRLFGFCRRIAYFGCMQTWINPVESIREFLKEFQLEIAKYRGKATSFGTGQSLFDFIPGYQLFETDLNSLLDVYYSPLGLKSEQELPPEWKMPFHELALISYLSLTFKSEILNKKYFISCLFRTGKSYSENPYPAMRFQLHMAQHLRALGNKVVPKFLNLHEDYDMLVISPTDDEVEVECKIQSDESGKRIDRAALENMMVFLREAASLLNRRIKIYVSCDEGIRIEDVEDLIPLLKVGAVGKVGHQLIYKVGNKTFQVLIEYLGYPTDVVSTEEMFGCLKPDMEQLCRIGIVSKTPPPKLEDFSFVAMKSAKNNRPLTNIAGHFTEASRQFTGKRPSLLALHHDADVDVKWVSEFENFQKVIVFSFGKFPQISGFAYSSMDKLNPSGNGYPFGSFATFPSLSAVCPIVGVKLPGLFN